ncbi:uncharacterized protein LOC108088106 [Drosophila ficusphila]|uniref:uncharacterized protein LOC108088106 n=1 Tax=Drosophila ficusphila TaxID=30025 RepID=UPI0007E7A4D3|nr:uncharacterized protein LOC108088106 [Drosophila ficusphila]
MSGLKIIHCLPIFIIFNAFWFADLKTVSETVHDRLWHALSSVGIIVQSGGMSMEKIGESLASLQHVPKAKLQTIKTLMGQYEKENGAPAQNKTCNGLIMCRVKGIIGFSKTVRVSVLKKKFK